MEDKCKTRVGIYLNIKPNFGGVFQYALTIISALDSLDETKYELYAFYEDEAWDQYLNQKFIKKKFTNKKWFRFFILVFKAIFQNPKAWRLSGKWSNGVTKINNSQCEIVIFPSQDSSAYQINKKSIATIHDLMHRYEPHFGEYGLIGSIVRDLHYSSMCKYANKILVDSTIGKMHVIESYSVDPAKLEILPFVAPKYLLEKQNVNICEIFKLPERFIFYPAQFWEHKNHENLLRALKLSKDRGVEINLVLVGSKKNNYLKVIELIDTLQINKYIYILGYVSNEEMAALYKNAVAMVFPSLIGPTNIPPVEAMMMGCPLVCSNAYGMPEQVGDAALLFDPRDPTDIAEKIESIWSNAKIRETLIDNGLKKIAQYSQIEFNKKLENIIFKTK